MFAFLAALLPLIPSLAGLLGGDKAETVAARVVPAVQALTGATEPDAAVAALKADPTLLLQAQKLVSDTLLAMEREETERLRVINQTMQAEANSTDPYVRRWRPHFGYVMSWAWAGQTVAICVAVIGATVAAALGQPLLAEKLLSGVAELVSSLTVQWAVALTVVGVSVAQRGKDKGEGSLVTDLLGNVLARKK